MIVADLDSGALFVPEGESLPSLPSPLNEKLMDSLCYVLHPRIYVADHAFPNPDIKPSENERLDKEIRAIFLRIFAQLLQGYRSCLTLIRIHPKPIIAFNKVSICFISSHQNTNLGLPAYLLSVIERN